MPLCAAPCPRPGISNISTTMRASSKCCSMAPRRRSTACCGPICLASDSASRCAKRKPGAMPPRESSTAKESNVTHIRREAPRFSAKAAAALATDLRRRLRGEVRFGTEDRALYATDSSNYRQVPIGVVIPRDADDVVETVALCREYGAPVLPRGCGTSLSGETCNVAVVIDFTKHVNGILHVDYAKKQAR